MKNLYLRIYLTVVAVLLLFALSAGWLAHHKVEEERHNFQAMAVERAAAWGALIENSLPAETAPEREQRDALLDWSERLRVPLALDNQQGQRIATSELYTRREAEAAGSGLRGFRIPLADGRALWLWRPGLLRGGPPPGPGFGGRPPPGEEGGPPPGRRGQIDHLSAFGLPLFVGGVGLVATLIVLFVAVAAGAYPVVRRLTRRLEALKQGMAIFGAGQLGHRVGVDGRDEIAAVAQSFNHAADRIEQLLRSHQTLLANASHELRSPLARMKMAVAMFDDAPAPQRETLRHEIHTNIAELDALVEEVLLASRLDAQAGIERHDPVDLIALAAEEGARVDAVLQVDGEVPPLSGNERLLRRALRNLLENARRYGGHPPDLTLVDGAAGVELRVEDRGPGVPADMRERIFEPFFRLPGHAEQAGGVGLGLSLVKQIAERHGGSVHCGPRAGGGSSFVLRLPRL